MTVFRNDGRWDRSNVAVRRQQVVRYDKRASDAGDAAHRLRPRRRSTAAASRWSPTTRRSTWPTSTADLARDGRLAGYEATSAFYEIGSPSGLARDATAILRGSLQTMSDSSPQNYLRRGAATSRAASTRREVERMIDILRRGAQHGGRLFILGVGGSAGNAGTRSTTSARSRHRGLRADRQRLRADRAHQRRRLGTSLRELAARSAASAPTTSCFVFSVGGGNLEKNVSPNLVRGAEARQAGRRQGDRRGRPRRRLHRAGRRRLRRSCRRSTRRTSRRTPKRSRPWSGICMVTPSQAAWRTR